MGDEGFDPCECVWGHELAMRRLISLLRQSQSYCTDTECFQDVGNQSTQDPDAGIFFMSLALVFALFMYYLRPRPQNGAFSEPTKSHIGNNGSDGPPRNPPPATF